MSRSYSDNYYNHTNSNSSRRMARSTYKVI